MNSNYALITGASSGIGLELARIHAERGGNCILIARNEKALKALAADLEEKYGIHAPVISIDLTADDAVQTIIKNIDEEKWTVDILINNAGFGGYGAFAERKTDDDLSMIDLNIKALTELTHAILPSMMKRKSGRILNLASTAAFVPGPLQAVYYASKAFVLSLSEALSEELRGTGVTVTALCPGPVATGFASAANATGTRAFQYTASPVHTAACGYRDLMKGKRLSFDNRFLQFSLLHLLRLMPRSLVLRLSKKTMEDA